MAVMKYWNGSAWKQPFFRYPKIWNGSEWVQAVPSFWDGTRWKESDFVGSSFVVTVGNTGSYIFSGGINIISTIVYTYFGFSSTTPINGTSAFGSCTNSSVTNLYWYNVSVNGVRASETNTIVFSCLDLPNNSWTTMTIGTSTYLASNATFSSTGNVGTWAWITTPDNPFGVAGGNVNVSFA